MFPCRVSWKNYLIFLGKVCIFFEHSILPIMTILLNGTFFVQNKCCAVGGILWNFHVVFRWLSHLHNSTTLVLSITMRIQQDWFCGHTKSYLARRFNESIWNYLKLSGNIWKHLKISENILMIFWKQMKLSEIIRWFPALSEIATSKTWAECVFFAEKNDTAQRHRQGVRGTCAPVCCDKVQFLLL